MHDGVVLAYATFVETGVLQAELGVYEGCQHVKTDLVASKGICFAKYTKASTAHKVIETINAADGQARL
jgi:hypothetical protein